MKRRTLFGTRGHWVAASFFAMFAGCNSVPVEKITSSADVSGSRASLGATELNHAESDATQVDELPVDLAELEETGEVFVAFKTTEIDVAASAIAAGVPGPGVMGIKLQDAINTLSNPQADELAHINAVDQVIEASPPAISSCCQPVVRLPRWSPRRSPSTNK